jgi:hypothetical protein
MTPLFLLLTLLEEGVVWNLLYTNKSVNKYDSILRSNPPCTFR